MLYKIKKVCLKRGQQIIHEDHGGDATVRQTMLTSNITNQQQLKTPNMP